MYISFELWISQTFIKIPWISRHQFSAGPLLPSRSIVLSIIYPEKLVFCKLDSWVVQLKVIHHHFHDKKRHLKIILVEVKQFQKQYITIKFWEADFAKYTFACHRRLVHQIYWKINLYSGICSVKIFPSQNVWTNQHNNICNRVSRWRHLLTIVYVK